MIQQWDLSSLSGLLLLSAMVKDYSVSSFFPLQVTQYSALEMKLKFPPSSYGSVITNVTAFTGEI